jgi:hypothetical protein
MTLTEGLDLIDELRLRSWAREHYVARDERCGDWHPVILEEMQRRDAESALDASSAIPSGMFSYHRRLDAMYGPHEISPHFGQTPALTGALAHEMHYF